MMRYRPILLFSLILCLSMSHIAQAAQETAPLLMLISESPHQGNLWAWTGPDQPLKQLTTWGYNYFPVIAPDGKSVAYDSVPPDFVNFQCCGWPPADIAVLNLETGKNTRIVGQPPDIAQGVTHRPQPAWSPDSKALAWGEIPRYKVDSDGNITGFDGYQLVAYHLDTNRQRVVVHNLPGIRGLVDGTVVDWGSAGFTFYGFNGTDPFIYLYSSDGKLLVQHVMTSSKPCDDPPALWAIWVTDHDQQYSYFSDCSGPSRSGILIDPMTGQITQTSGVLERYSLSAPDAMSVFLTSTKDAIHWNLAIPGKAAIDLSVDSTYYSPLDLVAIAPDGRQVAYMSNKGLMLYDWDGQSKPVNIKLKENQDVEWLGWGPTGWRLRHQSPGSR